MKRLRLTLVGITVLTALVPSSVAVAGHGWADHHGRARPRDHRDVTSSDPHCGFDERQSRPPTSARRFVSFRCVVS
jgi:hypothetical protein